MNHEALNYEFIFHLLLLPPTYNSVFSSAPSIYTRPVADAKDQASHSIREELLKLQAGVSILVKQEAARLL
jgi:hypothetical protein